MQWRFLDTGSGTAGMNMAVDEAMLQTHDAGATPPTLRVYGWQVPTLSLGYAQKTAQEVRLEVCRQCGVAVVRRPTGGRAVLHDDEVTYSVVMPIDLPDGSRTLTEHYRLIGLALLAALWRLGLPVILARPQRSVMSRQGTSPACFAALSRYELSVAGKKLVGSAQKRSQNALLQHGSMPFTLDRDRLFQCLNVPPEQRAHLVQDAYVTMTAIHEVAATPIGKADLHEALRHGFSTTFGVALVTDTLSSAEQALAQQLYASKYATSAWNLGGASVWRQSSRAVPALPAEEGC
jgi:lipoate-protein ligase A